MGNVDTTATSPTTPYNAEIVSNKGNSTVKALAAAQNVDNADVNGNVAELRVPWLAYVSHTAALRAFKATASVTRASVLVQTGDLMYFLS